MSEPNNTDSLASLKVESLSIIEAAFGIGDRIGLLFSGGKDSILLLHLVLKYLQQHPSKKELVLLHIDTGFNFNEIVDFVSATAKKAQLRLEVGHVNALLQAGGAAKEFELGGRNAAQAAVLRQLIEDLNLEIVFGGARRDEDKARAKEKVFSVRPNRGGWNPSLQEPEFWNIPPLSPTRGFHYRCFPLSNWTETNVWQVVITEKLALPNLYFAHQRRCWVTADGFITALEPESKSQGSWQNLRVRARTVGDQFSTGFIRSLAATPAEVVQDNENLKTSERSLRADDRFSAYSMEDRKKLGYF